MAEDRKRKWEITLWANGTEEAGVTQFEGTWAEADAEALERAATFEKETGRTCAYDVMPDDLLFQSAPNGWVVDEVSGELVWSRAPHEEPFDPLPHLAVRAFKGGGVTIVFERGLPQSKRVMEVVGRVVKRHLGSAKQLTIDTVIACQRALEIDVGRLAARRLVTSSSKDGARVWS